MPKIINKNTNVVININYNATPENLIAYYGSNWQDWLVIPIELREKEVVVINGVVVEKPVDIEILRQRGLAYYQQKAELFRQQKIDDGSGGILINRADGSTVIVSTDLTMTSLNDWLIVKNKIGSPKKANIINKITGLNEIVEITDAEVIRINGLLTTLVDNITELDVRITNKIKTASQELILAVFSLAPDKLELFTLTLMQNAQNILQMTDKQFDIYIKNIIQAI